MMMRTTIALTILAVAMALPAASQAASFDCAKAATPTEHAICDNPQLSQLDDQTSGMYYTMISNGSLTPAKVSQVKAPGQLPAAARCLRRQLRVPGQRLHLANHVPEGGCEPVGRFPPPAAGTLGAGQHLRQRSGQAGRGGGRRARSARPGHASSETSRPAGRRRRILVRPAAGRMGDLSAWSACARRSRTGQGYAEAPGDGVKIVVAAGSAFAWPVPRRQVPGGLAVISGRTGARIGWGHRTADDAAAARRRPDGDPLRRFGRLPATASRSQQANVPSGLFGPGRRPSPATAPSLPPSTGPTRHLRGRRRPSCA